MKRIITAAFLIFGFANSNMAQTITSVTVNGTTFCAGVPINATTITSGSFNAGNIFSAMLSDASGSFASGITVLTITSGDAGSTFTTALPNVTAQGTQYRIKVMASDPATELISAVDLTLNPNATLYVGTSGVTSTSICSNSSPVVLIKNPQGGTFSNTSSSGAIGNNFYPSLAQNGTNTITYIPANGCASATATISMNQTPATPIISGASVICPNSTNTLSVLNFNSSYIYSWGTAGGNTNAVQITIGGNYSVSATNNGCTSVSNTFAVNASSAPQNFSINAPDTLCANSNPVLLSGIPAGGSFDTANVVGGYFTPNISLVGTNTITYSYTNQFGCEFLTNRTIVVDSAALIGFTPLAQPLCLNQGNFNLNTLFSPSSGNYAGLIYSGIGVTGNMFNPNVGTQSITCNYTNAFGCTTTRVETITVLPAAPINFILPANICLGTDSIVLIAAPLNGVFSGNGVINGIFYATIAGVGVHTITYSVSSNTTSCAATASATIIVYSLTVNAGADVVVNCGTPTNLLANTNYQGAANVGFAWNNGITLSNPAIANPVATPGITTTYIVTTMVDACVATDTVNITITPAQFNVIFSNQTTFLAPPFNVLFSNNTPNPFLYNFFWDFGDGSTLTSNSLSVVHQYLVNDSFNVSLTATNLQTGCMSGYTMQNAVITSNACTHTATINQTSPIVGCVGDDILLTCNTASGFQYQWNLNGFPISGAPNSSYLATQSGIYTVTIYYNSCPQASAPVQVILNSSPAVPNISVIGSLVFCGGGSTTLAASAGFNTYAWKKNGAPFGNTQSVNVTETGYYSVSTYDANNCSSTSAQQAINTSFLSPPNMCIVSVDTVTSKPVLEWEKPTSLTGIQSYILMRESAIANVYDTIPVSGSNFIAVNTFSSIIDFGDAQHLVNTAIKSYKYQLAIQDTCFSTTLPSSYHKTILLQTSLGTGNIVNLLWNNYEGVPIASYRILRGHDAANLHTIAVVAASSGQTNLFTDYVPNIDSTYIYRVDLELPVGYFCDPSELVERAQRRVTSSNIGSNKTVTGVKSVELSNEFSIMPNPSNGNFIIDYKLLSNDVLNIDVKNVLGKTLHTETWTNNGIEGNRTLHLPQLDNGVYFVTFKQNNKINSAKVVINK